MKQQNILISTGAVTRLVTHLDIDRHALETLVAQWKAFLAA
jgi:threonine aldolase